MVLQRLAACALCNLVANHPGNKRLAKRLSLVGDLAVLLKNSEVSFLLPLSPRPLLFLLFSVRFRSSFGEVLVAASGDRASRAPDDLKLNLQVVEIQNAAASCIFNLVCKSDKEELETLGAYAHAHARECTRTHKYTLLHTIRWLHASHPTLAKLKNHECMVPAMRHMLYTWSTLGHTALHVA